MMFVSQERNSNKKRFQKPNILRRKPKTPVGRTETLNGSDSFGSPNSRPDITNSLLRQTIIDDLQLDNISKYDYTRPFQTDQKESIQSLNFENGLLYGPIDRNQGIDLKQHSNQDLSNESSLLVNIVNYTEESPLQSSVNVESFFNGGQNRENMMLFAIDPDKEMQTLVIIDESHENSLYNEQSDDLITSMVPMSAITTPSRTQSDAQEQTFTVVPVTAPSKMQSDAREQTFTVVPPQQLLQNLSFGSTKFKCDVPDCNKEFRSEQKLKRHKNIHNKDGSIRLPRQVTSECPVKKVNPDGTEQRCGKIYLIREQLVKHLNEDHTIEDAAYRCDECGRQFFWASGLRAHLRSHSPRARPAMSLACGWPGCGRVFTQPCRLREHARAHTGDRPYPCTFPNCGSSFRSASKLERHARRHTGLRRHACAACGRAFLRREHLRDHAARHHRPHPPLCCPHTECEELFEEADALQEHIHSAHPTEENAPAPQADVGDFNKKDDLDYIFLAVEDAEAVNEEPPMEKTSVESEESTEIVVLEQLSPDSRAARTHCPWPLARLDRIREDAVCDNAEEQAEGSESNIYTVRSDLFLHGNVLINEDSVQMVGAVESAPPAESPDELGLGLLEHPHMDLMQEEMMFTVWQ